MKCKISNYIKMQTIPHYTIGHDFNRIGDSFQQPVTNEQLVLCTYISTQLIYKV
jgi:hypothetical protein